MKTKAFVLFAMFLMAGIFSASAQTIDTTKVPAVVKTHFYGKYTTAKDVEWKMSDQNYRVKYEIGDIDYKITYTPTGDIVSSEKEIRNTDLPGAVTAAIAKDFPGYKIDDADEITTNGVITYKVDLDGEPDMDAWYHADGTLIRKAVDK